MNYLGKCLAIEYKSKGIFVQTIYTNQVHTPGNALADPLMAVYPDAYVRAVLKTVGIESETNGHPKHKLVNTLTQALGALLGEGLFMKIKLIMVKDVRSRAEKAEKAKTKTNSVKNKLEQVVPVQ